MRLAEENNLSGFPPFFTIQTDICGFTNTPQMATGAVVRHVVLTGPPGVGKTTLIHKTCEALQSAGIPIQGFYTEELRAHGRRTGFDVVTLNGQRAPLARVSNDSMPSTRREYRVGQYAVQLQAFEQAALPVLRRKLGEVAPVFVIDEIGKMEMFSQSFKQAVQSLLDAQDVTVLTTIPIAKNKPIAFVEDIRNRRDVKLFTVSKENRNALVKDIVATVQESHRTHTVR